MTESSQIEKFLSLSTAHVPGPNPEWGVLSGWTIEIPGGYGWMVLWANTTWEDLAEDSEGAPEWFKPIHTRMRALGCKGVVFDCDGPVMDNLPSFDW